MLRDGHSNYCWHNACSDTLAYYAARAVINRSATFSVPSQLMSNGSIRFRNEVSRLATKRFHVPDRFKCPYLP